MRTILLLAVLSGKLDDPAPRASTSGPTVTHKLDDPAGWPPRDLPVAIKPDAPESVKPKPEPEPPAKSDPLPPAPKSQPQPSKPPAMPAPKVHFRKDATGKTWYHADLRWLETHVGQVNASLASRYYAAPAYQPVYQFGSPCANGSCPR